MVSEHGGLKFEELEKAGFSADQVIDFSVSVNPYPLPPSVRQAICKADVEHYPDPSATLLKRKLAALQGFQPENILVVNGTSQGMYLIASAFLHNQETALICGPTYSEYFDACKMHDARISFLNAEEDRNFYHEIPKICAEIKKQRPSLFWLCTPNNPTGVHHSMEDVKTLQTACKESGTLLVLDEAYISFTSPEKRYSLSLDNTLILRSMTKDFRLAGIRLGYLIGAEQTINLLAKWQPEWSVSSPAQEAGLACLEELPYFSETWAKTRVLTDNFQQGLRNGGFEVLPTDSNFFLIKVGDAATYQKRLWANKIKVRDCTSFGLPQYIRVGTCSEKENNTLIAEMIRIKEEQ